MVSTHTHPPILHLRGPYKPVQLMLDLPDVPGFSIQPDSELIKDWKKSFEEFVLGDLLDVALTRNRKGTVHINIHDGRIIRSTVSKE